jgi:preprotein translocase subunit SecA
MLSKQIEKAQKKVEEQYFLMRKHTLEYDDVLNQQREVIYNYRDEILEGRDMGDVAREEVSKLIERMVEEHTNSDFVEDWDIPGLLVRIQEIFRPSDEILSIDPDRADREDLILRLQDEALEQYDRREQELGEIAEGELLIRALERFLLLQIIDQRWREHLHDMDYLREGIHLRGLAQLDPLVAYKNEGFTLFGDLMNLLWHDFARMIYHVQVTVQDGPPPGPGAQAPLPTRSPSQTSSSSTGGGRVSYTGGGAPAGAQALAAAAGAPGAVAAAEDDALEAAPVVQQRHTDANEPGRNDPCWCGSGKKYKRCHGA